MPSGAKKRKAAKKKKEKETEFFTNHPQGNDDLKSHSQGSDGGEGDSSSHGDHDHPFNEGNEEVEERDPSGARSFASVEGPLEGDTADVKIDETEGGKGGTVVIEWDLNSEESSESKDASVLLNESAKEVGRENGNTGGSNDKTETLEKSQDERQNSTKETVAFDKLVESINYSHGKVTLTSQNVTTEDTGDSVVESSTDSVKAVASESEVKSTDTGNALLEKSTGSQVGASDLDVKKNEGKVYPFDQNVGTSSLEEHKPKDFDTTVSASVSRSPVPEDTNGAKNVQHSDTPESSGNQPLVPSGPQVVQKTSWLSCCGLFELLSGSNR